MNEGNSIKPRYGKEKLGVMWDRNAPNYLP